MVFRKPPELSRIFWDLDDTMNSLMEAWLQNQWKKEDRPACKVEFSQLSENPPDRILGCARQDYYLSLDRFRNSLHGSQLTPRPEILAWFQLHGFSFEHHVITARPPDTVATAAEWAFRHFGRWVRHFHYTPAARTPEKNPGPMITKGEIIRRLGGGYAMIDDSLEQLESAGDSVRLKILVPQPWNHQSKGLRECLQQLCPGGSVA